MESTLASKTDNILSRSSNSAHAAVETAAKAAEDAVNKARPAIDKLAGVAHRAVDKAADAAGPTAEWIIDQTDKLNQRQKKLLDNSSHYISANPLKSVAIAAAVGFLVSRITR